MNGSLIWIIALAAFVAAGCAYHWRTK